MIRRTCRSTRWWISKATPPQVNVKSAAFSVEGRARGIGQLECPGNPTAELADMLKDVKLIRVV